MSFPYIPLIGAHIVREFLKTFGQVYDRRCIADEGCATEERIAAACDYLGTVYGPAGQGRYDHVLMDSEREYVEQNFGRLTDFSQIGAYLSKAHSVFLKQFPTPKQCPEGPPVTLRHTRLGQGLVLYGAHGCGEAHAKQLSQSGLELAMAAHPQEWTFFIEGAQPGEWLEKGKQLEMGPEVKLLQRMAAALHIPIKEALAYNPTHPRVLEEAAKKSGYRREELIVGAVFQVVLSHYRPGADQNTLLTQTVNAYAPYFKINPEKLAEELNSFLKEYKQDQVKESGKRMKILLESSNQLSADPLRKELEALAEKKDGPPKSLVLVGKGHLALVEKAYAE